MSLSNRDQSFDANVSGAKGQNDAGLNAHLRKGLEIAFPNAMAAGKAILDEAAKKFLVGDLVLVKFEADPDKAAVIKVVEDQLGNLYPGDGNKKLRDAALEYFKKKCDNEDFLDAMKKGLSGIDNDKKYDNNPELKEIAKAQLLVGTLQALMKATPPEGFTRDQMRRMLGGGPLTEDQQIDLKVYSEFPKLPATAPKEERDLQEKAQKLARKEALGTIKEAEKEELRKIRSDAVKPHLNGKGETAAVELALALHPIVNDPKFQKRLKALEEELKTKGSLPKEQMAELEDKRKKQYEYEACDNFRANNPWDQAARGKYIKARQSGVEGRDLAKLLKDLQDEVAAAQRKADEDK